MRGRVQPVHDPEPCWEREGEERGEQVVAARRPKCTKRQKEQVTKILGLYREEQPSLWAGECRV